MMKRQSVEEIFPEIELMKAVMAGAIKDYINGIGLSDTKKNRPVTGRANSALTWITCEDKSSHHYVFGFVYICKTIQIDPIRLRKRILLLRTRRDIEKLREAYFKR